MSKSDENANASVYLMDDADTVRRKFKRAVTDSEAEVRYDWDNKPGISNLMDIYGATTGKTTDEIEKEFAGKGYGDFKMAVGDAVAAMLTPMQTRFEELIKDKEYLDKMIKQNDEKAYYFSQKTLRKVKKKVGLTENIR